ncbi:F0F1 ATP synthase subunit alpha [soil metagenome]
MESSKLNVHEIGHIVSHYSGVIKIQGLPTVRLHEVLLDEQGREVALVIGFDELYVEGLLFDDGVDLTISLFSSQRVFSIPVSDEYIGRIVDGFGLPIDDLSQIAGEMSSVFREAPSIIERSSVERPLISGIKIIDTALPLGRGQRELIIGDRKIGKSTLGLDIILNQKHNAPPLYCIYVLCGQKTRQFEETIKLFKNNGTFLYTVIVYAPSDSSFANQYLAPFVGCAIGEYFRDQGKDALIVYDDLTKHAKVYRSISLLLERAPGREAYPGDIFSLHAGLLERAAQLHETKGGGSLTAIPIVETQEGDITSFIPTNIISITDGQIFLERGLFQKDFLPAVNVGLSVSRIGSHAQPPMLTQVTGGIRLALAQHKELQKLTQLETVVSKTAQKTIFRGELILELLKQDKHTYLSFEEESILFYVVEQGYFDEIHITDWSSVERHFLELLRTKHVPILHELKKDGFTDITHALIDTFIQEFKQQFIQ